MKWGQRSQGARYIYFWAMGGSAKVCELDISSRLHMKHLEENNYRKCLSAWRDPSAMLCLAPRTFRTLFNPEKASETHSGLLQLGVA